MAPCAHQGHLTAVQNQHPLISRVDGSAKRRSQGRRCLAEQVGFTEQSQARGRLTEVLFICFFLHVGEGMTVYSCRVKTGTNMLCEH